MITIGFSTRKDNPEFVTYLKNTSNLKGVQIIQKINNGEKSLSQVYNEILKESEYNYVVLLHDDVLMDTKNWGQKLIKHFKKNHEFGVLGVAGTTEIPESGRWWDDNRKMLGIVNHQKDGKKWESKYSKNWGDDITQSCFVDGLFIALDKTKIKNDFDESFEGFHFYDVNFCVNNFLNGVKIGVIYNIRLTHMSIGETNEKWEENRILFTEKFNKELPINSEINITYKNKTFNYIKKYNIKIIINCGDDIKWINDIIEKISSFDLPNYEINLICDDVISQQLNIDTNRIKIFDKHFKEFSKNLSILKWDDNFINTKNDLIFFIDDNVKLLNNIFTSMCNIYHSEKLIFGGIFSSTINDDSMILGTQINMVKNKENQINVVLRNNGSFYNLFDGYRENNMGNLSDVFVTTYNNLIKYDWFDTQYNTNVSFNDFAVKCFINNQKIFVDTDSITTHTTFQNTEKLNSDLNLLVQQIMTNPNKNFQSLITLVNG